MDSESYVAENLAMGGGGGQKMRSLNSFLNSTTETSITPDELTETHSRRPPPAPPARLSHLHPLSMVPPDEEADMEEAELQCSATAFFDAESDLTSIFTSPLTRRKEREEEIKKYEDQIRSLELDAVTLMDEMDVLNAFKIQTQIIEVEIRQDNERLKDETKSLRGEIRELKDNVSLNFLFLNAICVKCVLWFNTCMYAPSSPICDDVDVRNTDTTAGTDKKYATKRSC